MANYGTVDYYQEEVQRREIMLDLVIKGAKAKIFEMTRTENYDTEELKPLLEQIEYAKNSLAYAKKELCEAREKEANATKEKKNA